ncbi:hypothetical protein [Bizionia paragorgiae]|uniref:NlpE C-terminal OB domain-containing protein n=1 Tax=Bizionia paragorgiae TaxID=283786 RepID=A0A1H3VUS4_BIZPA|nr:hypothetical protein [Bizionia paragorgiae]SDZ78490.1 hypothetical protein SAMN04487990_10246 [Bizionia paragorgiae]
MKKILLLCMGLALLGCKDTKNETGVEETTTGVSANDGLTLFAGEYIYYADAAVLQIGSSSIYGVILNEKTKELNALAQTYKEEPTDGVLVQVRGLIVPKPEGEEGWPNSIEIKEIISVKKQNSDLNKAVILEQKGYVED